MSQKPQHSPYIAAPKKYSKSAQETIPPDESPNVGTDVINFTQKFFVAYFIIPHMSKQ